MNIADKNIVITGASRGLGRATAMELCRQGARVILVARNEEDLGKVKGEIKTATGAAALAIRCDIRSEEDVLRMSRTIERRYRHIDVLINNAGIGRYVPSRELGGGEMRRHFETNFFGAFYCTRALLPLIAKSSAGYVLNIGSLFSRIALGNNGVYAATKHALAGFTEGLRRELRSIGIAVGLLMPGSMKTSFNRSDEDALKTPGFMVLDPVRVASIVCKMIKSRARSRVVYRWMLWMLRLKAMQRP